MDATQFEQQARDDADLSGLLNEIAQRAREQTTDADETPPQYVTVTGVDLLFTVAAYALYRYLKDHFDHRRARNEVEIARQQAKLIATLTEEGFPAEKADKVATALLERVARRAEDDPALQKAVALIGGAAK